jgi:hypothetical protein
MVSIWRSYALAERWLSLQTHRRVSFAAAFFASVVALEAFQWKRAASTSPNLDALESELPGVHVPESYVSRVALIVLIFTLLWIVQVSTKCFPVSRLKRRNE